MSDAPAAVLIAKRTGRAPLTLLSASVLARFDVLERTDFLMMVFVYGWRYGYTPFPFSLIMCLLRRHGWQRSLI
jgi:hypothetical protein